MNLAYITIKPNTAYQDLGTLSSVTFNQGDTYVMQVVEGNGLWIMEDSSLPTEGGFIVYPGEKFEYTAGSGTLYVKNISNQIDVVLNIAE